MLQTRLFSRKFCEKKKFIVFQTTWPSSDLFTFSLDTNVHIISASTSDGRELLRTYQIHDLKGALITGECLDISGKRDLPLPVSGRKDITENDVLWRGIDQGRYFSNHLISFSPCCLSKQLKKSAFFTCLPCKEVFSYPLCVTDNYSLIHRP